ncbi:DUF3303 family protein [Wenxinia marina]|uniref:Uncharacterized protein n=1 Tax=Wenxinia marina DSM 24838 TaxID=1123501 RepID=A0A0D0QHD9_9RHOB|nr:DUF3303 family protein [Wenxinia marina]KIQ70483.1 hypothetical protein Wenmar_00859 [Wenxinia marina DSM 24838]GGL52751.1 hypothetical protein GCM10011392_03920 [Wenxinia marina]
MQMICRFDTVSWDEWKPRFDGDAEDRMHAGLTLLQMWRDVDTPDAVVALFEVNDRSKADAWVAKQSGFGAALRADFLRTA